ncbi:hypothetical protein K1719_015456 [Acacia pycnantha]|nr:hypothetical protein K1719_015456 [Acacia pycnantha]
MALDSHKLIAASGEPGDRVQFTEYIQKNVACISSVTLIQHPVTNISTFCSSSIVEVEMSVEPPPFQESARCDVCNCSFNTFRRRHHCRRCGRTLCHEHSSNQMALPQFGIYSNVRVCADCFNNSGTIY